MRIARVDAIPVRIPLKPERRMISALGRHDASDYVLVRLETDDGLVGAGEATVTPRWSGETVWGAQAIIQHLLGPAILGVDPSDIDELDRRMDALAFGNWFAKSALEMACWDLAGKSRNQPVFDLLGGPCRPLTVRSRFSMGAYAPDVAARLAAERVAAGFDTIKVKVGTVADQDVARVLAVRQAVGSDVTLTIDANAGWDFLTAVDCLHRLSDARISLVEQPLARGDHSGARRLRELTGLPLLADESCFDEAEARELIVQGACDALTLYPGKQGGILKALRIALLAAEHGLPCCIGSNLEWDVATAAMLHFVVATPNIRVESLPGDCLGPFYHEQSIALEPLEISGPFTTIPAKPGLGVDVDWDLVDRLRADRLR